MAGALAFLTLAACATTPDPVGSPVPRLPDAPASASELVGAPSATLAAEANRFGVLVMAHGGSPEWNRQVGEAVTPLARRTPVAVAFGMADPYTLRASLDSLRAAGVTRVAVVRMFLSGRSFLDQTEYFLGLEPTPPETFVLMGAHGGHALPRGGDGHASVPAAAHPAPIEHRLQVATHPDGLMTSPEARRIVRERVRSVRGQAGEVSVLVVAHGMGDERENDEVLGAMERIASDMAGEGYAAVEVATLREDWAEKRQEAEQHIRGFVERESAAGRRVVVAPMRLSGFGPYAQVLEGLDYVPAEALLPHEALGGWIGGRALAVACAEGWTTVCPIVAESEDGALRD